jgi:hypothetical protein
MEQILFVCLVRPLQLTSSATDEAMKPSKYTPEQKQQLLANLDIEGDLSLSLDQSPAHSR